MRRYQQTKQALGSAAYLTLVVPTNRQPDDLFADLWRYIDEFEQRFSRFLAISELSACNKAAGSKHMVSPEFRQLLVIARDMSERTGGLYNPFVLPALQRAGYKGSWPYPDEISASLDFAGRQSASWRDIQIGKDWIMIPKNTALDFGGIGKGYLLDELAARLRARAVDSYWLSLGGDIVCAGLDDPGIPWEISIQDAVHENNRVAYVSNQGNDLAVATSGVTKRKGTSAHGAWHHLIDPRTGEPALSDVLTATVCAESATEADVYAKCLVIVGSTETDTFMESVTIRNVLLQQTGSGTTSIVQKKGLVWQV